MTEFEPVEPRRVRMTQASQWAGEAGRLVAIHLRLPIYRVQLDRQPIQCTTREFLVGPEQFEAAR